MKICDFEITDKIYESPNSLIYRTKTDEGQPKVILKVLREDYPVPEELLRFHREFEITRLIHSPNVIKVLGVETFKNTLALLVEDFGGESLATSMRRSPFSVVEGLRLAIEICQGIADIHAQAVVHKDICPSNLVWSQDSKIVKIIDFGIATQLERSLTYFTPPGSLEGSMSYMSPEQTGRMNRPLDYRSDFYSLGITLYEIFTGKRPFETDDPLSMIHCHIAKEPLAPDAINPAIPAVLSQIIVKLLAKSADDRYQSAEGIKADLMETLRQFEEVGKVDSFSLAMNDTSPRFHLPAKLYGRDEPVGILANAFERVCSGETIFTLVSGYSGVGKSSLVQELYRPLAIAKGRYISGKFDQYQRNIPYSALAQALSGWCAQITGESTKVFAAWRKKIMTAVGKNGQVLMEVIPDLEKIIGPQPAVASIDSQAAQNRFNQLFQDLVDTLCRPESPLILFLDDLQWADGASLAMLKTIVMNSRMRGLHLVGAYRDNEVDASHPLFLTLHELEKEGRAFSTVHLENLSLGNVTTLISDTLALPDTAVADLAGVVYAKTDGNAFFTTEFVKALHAEGLIAFSYDRRRWVWDIRQINARLMTDNVVELMAGKIILFPEYSQKMLKLAACIGNQFDLKTLATIAETNNDLALTLEYLLPAIHQGIVFPKNENYRRIGITDVKASNVIFKFQHDRVQQAAYSLISEMGRPKVHLQIARLLLGDCTNKDEIEKNLFSIVTHSNKGRSCISDTRERIRFASLNLQAGIKSGKASAHSASFDYLSIAWELLPENVYDTEYELALEVQLNLARSCYVIGKFDDADGLYPIILKQARTTLDKVKLHLVQMEDYHLRGDYGKAIGVQAQALILLGERIPDCDKDWALAIERELQQIPTNLGKRSVADLDQVPEIESADVHATLKLLMGMWMSAYLVSKEDMVQWSAVRMANLCLRHGNCDLAAFAFVQFGYLCIARLQQFETGYEYGQLALKISDRYDSPVLRGKVYFMFGLVISHWKKHVSYSTEALRTAYLSSVAGGDWTYAVYGAANIISNLIISGTPCDEVFIEANKYHEFLKDKATVGLNSFFHPGAYCALLNLQGKTSSRNTFNCEFLDEETHLKTLGQLPIVEAWFFAVKIRSLFLFRCFEEGAMVIAKAEIVAVGVPGQVKIPEAYFYSGLMLAATHQNIIETATKEYYWGLFEKYKVQMKLWADHCPENFLHKYYLLEAEKTRVENAHQDVVVAWYDKAISATKDSQFNNVEALAHELKGRFLLEKGPREGAIIELKEALYRYRIWGAASKVTLLEEEFPELVKTISRREAFATSQGTGMLSGAYLDLLTVHKAARAISSEISLEKLVKTMLTIVIESAGAQRGLLLLPKGGQWFVEAEAMIGQSRVDVNSGLNLPVELERGERAKLPVSVINYVIRTQAPVILKSGVHDQRFANDAYVVACQLQSAFCMPLILQNKTVGLIYLENNRNTDVFNAKQKEILDFLAAQIAISLENARLFANLQTTAALLATQNGTLQKLNFDLLRSNRELEQFAYVASHDLQSPLKSVVNWVQMLDFLVPKPRKEELDQAIKFIESNAQKATNLINDVMEMARVSVAATQVSHVDLNALVQGILTNLEQEIRSTQAKVSCDPLPSVDGIPTYLESIFKNLIQNALIYRDKLRAPDIRVGFKEDNEFYEIYVNDNGIGIDPQHQERIFKMFTRLHKEHEYPGGSGIGLAFAKKVVELCGGRIWVNSVPCEGSTFFFTYPKRWGGGGEKMKPHVMIIDDAADQIQMMRAVFKIVDPSLQIISASSGDEAIKTLRTDPNSRPKVILLDLRMPGKSGVEVLAELKSDPDLRRIPVCAFSNGDVEMDVCDCYEAGASFYFKKPTGLEPLKKFAELFRGIWFEVASHCPH